MALVSIRTLVAPASNSIHLVSIGFVVLLFGFLRWSGGDISISRSGRSAPAIKSDRLFDTNIPAAEPKQPSTNRLPQRGVVNVPEEAADDLLDSILANDNDVPARKPNPAAGESRQKPRSGTSALDEIERSLGLK